MEPDVLKRALDAKLTAGEWKVLAAMALGHLDIYDIQRETGLQRVRVEAVVQNARRILRIQETSSNSLLEEDVQNARSLRRLPHNRILDYLHTRLNRPLTYTPDEQAAAKKVYERAYEFTFETEGKYDAARAVQLVEDCIEAYMSEEFNRYRKSGKPAITLQKQISTYLAALKGAGPMPVEMYLMELHSHKRFRYNHITSKKSPWEERKR